MTYRRTADEADVEHKSKHETSTMDHYRVALVGMLEETLTVEELEAMACAHAERLEHDANDVHLACRAVVRHCSREIHEKSIRAGDLSLPYETRQVYTHRIRILTEIRERWLARHPIPEHLRSHIP